MQTWEICRPFYEQQIDPWTGLKLRRGTMRMRKVVDLCKGHKQRPMPSYEEWRLAHRHPSAAPIRRPPLGFVATGKPKGVAWLARGPLVVEEPAPPFVAPTPPMTINLHKYGLQIRIVRPDAASTAATTIRQIESQVMLGGRVSLGNGAIVLISVIGAPGSEGTVFSGKFEDADVAIKVFRAPLISKKPGERNYTHDNNKLSAFGNEYSVASRVDSGPGTAVVGSLGIVAFMPHDNANIFGMVIMEPMEITLKALVDLISNRAGMNAGFKHHIGVYLLLHMLKKIRMLHAQGVWHEDAHYNNWMIKDIDTVMASPINMDIRLIDLGQSCTDADGISNCRSQVQRKPDSQLLRAHSDFKELNEYVQFMLAAQYPMIKLVEPSMKRIEKDQWDIIGKEWKEFMMRQRAYKFNYLPRNIQRMSFESLVSCRTSIEALLTHEANLFTPDENQAMCRAGLLRLMTPCGSQI